MAEPTPPIEPTPVDLTVSAAKRTVPIANSTQLAQYFAGTYLGGLTWGDDVVCALGTYAPAAPYTLPAVTSVAGTQTGTDYITFRSANLSVLPAAGVTVNASHAGNMPTFTAPAATNGVFICADNARNFRFLGLNLAMTAGSYGGLFLQSPSANTSETTHPRNIIVDRCLVHLDPLNGGFIGVQCCGRSMAVMNCAVYDVFSNVSAGSIGVGMNGGAGPYLVHQNDIAISGHGVFVGDSVLNTPGVIPSDITITENSIYVPTALNNMGFLYNAGSAALNVTGSIVTLSGGTTDAAWVDGSTYWHPTGVRNSNGYYKTPIKIIGRDLDGVNTLRLASAWPDDGTRGASGLLYHVTKWDGRANGTHKNLFETKHLRRLKLASNIFGTCPYGAQNNVIIFSQRSEGAAMEDILVQDNLLLDCANAFAFTGRSTDGTGQGFAISAINGSSGGLITVHCTGNLDIATSGANCEIRNVNGCTEANGIWPMTRIDATTFTIPVTYSGITWGGVASVTVYKACSPGVRVAIKNNLVLNVGSPQAMLTDSWPDNYAAFGIGINTNPILVATGGSLVSGGNDGNLSTTGTWALNDICIEHNTIVGTRTPGRLLSAFNAIEYNNNSAATDWKSARFTFRNNILKATDQGSNAGPLIQYRPASTNLPPIVYGTTALDKFSDAARNFLHNVFFQPYNLTADLATLTGSDATKVAVLPTASNIGFTSYAGTGRADIGNLVLQDLYATGIAAVVNGSLTVTFSGGASLPTTIVKGVPFKGADNLYYLVESRVSATQLALQTAYLGANASGAYTLGFRGWSSDGSDPGANITTLLTAIANAGVGGGGGGGGTTTGAIALSGKSSIMGFAVIPQTP